MALKLQNVAGRIVVLKFQEELAKRRQEIAARPKPVPTPTPPMATPIPQADAITRGYYNAPPSGGGLLGAIGQGYSRLNRAATGGAANLTQLLGEKVEDFQNTVVIPNAYRAQLLSAGVLGTEGPPGTAGKSRLDAIREAIWPPSNAGSPTELANIQQSWQQNPAGYRMGMETLFHPASYYAGPEVLARLPEAAALGPEFVGALGVKSAVEATSRLATAARPAAEAKVAELYPTVREAAVGGEAGGLKLPFGKKAAEVPRVVRQLGGGEAGAEEVSGLKLPQMPGETPITGDELETLISNKARATGAVMEFPNPATTSPEQLATALDAEVARIQANTQPSAIQKGRLAVREFFNPKSPEGRTLIDRQVLQHATNRRRGDSIARLFEEWELSTKQRYFPTTLEGAADEITTIPEGIGLSRKYNDVMENPSRYAQWLSPEQMSAAKQRGATLEALANKFEQVTGEPFPRSYFANEAEYYSPRDVIKDPTGREATALGSPFEQRSFPTQAEGEIAGFEYSTNSPKAVGTAVRKVYNRISDEVMKREYGAVIGKKPIEYVAPELITTLKQAASTEKATLERVTAEMQSARAVQEGIVADLEKKVGWAKAGRSADLAPLKRARDAAYQRWTRLTTTKLKTAAWEQYRNANTTYKNAVASARTRLGNQLADAKVKLAETPKPTTAAIRGHTDVAAAHHNTRMVSANLSAARKAAEKAPTGFERVLLDRVGGNRIYPSEIAQAIKERYGVPETPSIYKTVAQYGTAPLRFAKTGFDFGIALVHGHSPLITHPESWGKGVGLGLRDVIRDEGRRAAYIAENKAVIREMIEQDWFPRTAVREFKLPVPEKVAKVSRRAGMVVKNIEDWFSHPLDIMSVEIYKQGKELYGITGADAVKMKELVDSLIPMTGTIRHAGGVNEGRLLFAANFVRSMANLMVNAVKPGIPGIEARRLFRNLFLLAGVGTVGLNEAMGRPWTLDLRKTNAFTVRVGNQNISLLGPWAPIFRGVAHAITGDPLYLATHTVRAKVAPGPPQWVVDILSKEDYMGRPVDITTPKGLLAYGLPQLAPIGPGQAAETWKGVSNPAEAALAAAGSILSIAGARMSPVTLYQKRDDVARQMFKGRDYAHLSPDEKDQLKVAHLEFEESQIQKTEQQYAALDQMTVVMKEMNDAKADYKAGMEQVPLQPDGPSQVAWYHAVQDNYIGGMTRIERSNPKVFAEWEKQQPKTPRQAVYKGYTDIFGRFSDPVTGVVPPDKKDAMFQAVDAYMGGLTDAQAADLNADIGAGDSPWLKQYHADAKAFKPYWDAESELWKALQGSVKELEAYPTYNDFYDWLIAQAVAGGLTREFVIASNMLDSFSIVEMFTSLRADYHDAQLAQNPEMARIGLHYGWISNIRQKTLPVVAGTLMGD